MIVCKSNKGLELSHQDNFNERTNCSNCGKEARFAFVSYEGCHEDKYISKIHANGDPSFWPHDAISVAIYFCTDIKCFQATAIWNQA